MTPTITISYEGEATLPHAEQLRKLLSSAGTVSEVEDVTPDGGELGIGTLLVSIVATSLAKAASKTLVGRLREFLQDRIKATDQSLRLLIDVKGRRLQSLGFSLERATLEAADKFCEQVENAIEALV
jgi:hypothetical protein